MGQSSARHLGGGRETAAGGTSLRTCGGERERRPTAADAAAGRPRRSAPRVDGRASMSPRTCAGEGRDSGGPPARTRPLDGRGRGRGTAGDERCAGGTSGGRDERQAAQAAGGTSGGRNEQRARSGSSLHS